MTAEVEEEEVSHQDAVDTNFNWPDEILEMIQFLSCNEKIIFKSLQIDDPELELSEKVQVAKEVYLKNRQTFLTRFGAHLEEKHLIAFGNLVLEENVNPPLTAEENGEEIHMMLQEYQRKLHTRKKDVKNRRYAAMQDLIAKGEYFSEHEMMRRAPELYQELIGQYLSDMEKKQRDSYDVKNTTFSGILMHTIIQKELSNVLEAADKQNASCEKATSNDDKQIEKSNSKTAPTHEEEYDIDSDEEENNIEHGNTAIADDYIEVPASCRQQWGNFDNEQIACSQSKYSEPKMSSNATTTTRERRPVAKLITAGERNLLREEFIGIMQAEFLAGNDADFDYTLVDDNTQLDDLRQLDQDKEDAYFEASDEEVIGQDSMERNGEQEDDESEDELDIYMQHLNKHHSLQK